MILYPCRHGAGDVLDRRMLLASQRVRGFLLCVCDVLSIACLQAGGSDLIIMLHYVEMCCQPWLRFLDSGKPGYTNISAQ